MSYTTRSKVEQYLNADLSAVDSWVTELISAAKIIIDRYTGKTFESASETRYFDGNGKDRLLIDPFHGTPTEVSLLNYDGTTDTTLAEGAANDYVAYPLNSTEKNELVMTPNSRRQLFSRAFDNILDDTDSIADASVRRLVKVTATFGNAASAPADIVVAATKIVAKWAEKRLKGGTPASESLGDYSISFQTMPASQIEGDLDADVKQVLDGYRDVEV